jgi:hypothetical protein
MLEVDVEDVESGGLGDAHDLAAGELFLEGVQSEGL